MWYLIKARHTGKVVYFVYKTQFNAKNHINSLKNVEVISAEEVASHVINQLILTNYDREYIVHLVD